LRAKAGKATLRGERKEYQEGTLLKRAGK